MVDDFIDNVLMNLKIISKVKKGTKLCIRKGNLAIDYEGYFQSLRRWILNDSRDMIIMHIKTVIGNACKIAEEEFDKPTADKRSWLLTSLYEEFRMTINGMENMKGTYHDDEVFKAQCDIMIDKIKIISNRLAKYVFT